MKKAYKVFSLLLVVAMTFVVCAIPVSATMLSYSLEEDPSIGSEDYYLNGIHAFGKIYYFPEDRQVHYETWCHNINSEQLTYVLYGQCVVEYADGSVDVFSTWDNFTIPQNGIRVNRGISSLPMGKTVIAFHAEFQVHDGNNLFWESWIEPTVTPGINI